MTENPSNIKLTFKSRLKTFHPLIERFIFGLAVFGILTTVHLWIQYSRGFDQGCWGFRVPKAIEKIFNCGAVAQSDSATLFGIPNIWLGFFFYLTIAFLSCFSLFTTARKLSTIKLLRAILILIGFLYTIYLVYIQSFKLGAFCGLCFISAIIVCSLLILQSFDLLYQIAFYISVVILIFVLIFIDLAYFAHLPSVSEVNLGETLPSETQTNIKYNNLQNCSFDSKFKPVQKYDNLVSDADPYVGNLNAPVTVIEYFDPNCRYCKLANQILKQVATQKNSKARFVYKPVVIVGQHSIAQVVALHVAAQENKFFEMLDHQFKYYRQDGLSILELRAIATEIGMNPDSLETHLRSGKYTGIINQQREQFFNIGLTGVPVVLINGQAVALEAFTVKCIEELIEQMYKNSKPHKVNSLQIKSVNKLTI